MTATGVTAVALIEVLAARDGDRAEGGPAEADRRQTVAPTARVVGVISRTVRPTADGGLPFRTGKTKRRNGAEDLVRRAGPIGPARPVVLANRQP